MKWLDRLEVRTLAWIAAITVFCAISWSSPKLVNIFAQNVPYYGLNATSIQNVLVSGTKPTDGQTLVYSASANQYQPGNGGGGSTTCSSVTNAACTNVANAFTLGQSVTVGSGAGLTINNSGTSGAEILLCPSSGTCFQMFSGGSGFAAGWLTMFSGASTGTSVAAFNQGGSTWFNNTGAIGWSGGNSPAGLNAGISSTGAGIINFGNGSHADASATGNIKNINASGGYAGSGVATYTVNANAGTGATAVTKTGYVADSTSGTITLTAGTGTPASGTILTVNFPNTRTNPPNCWVFITDHSANLAPFWSSTTTALNIAVSTPLTASTVYTVIYGCFGN